MPVGDLLLHAMDKTPINDSSVPLIGFTQHDKKEPSSEQRFLSGKLCKILTKLFAKDYREINFPRTTTLYSGLRRFFSFLAQ